VNESRGASRNRELELGDEADGGCDGCDTSSDMPCYLIPKLQMKAHTFLLIYAGNPGSSNGTPSPPAI
jgi:hypothetical protein